MSKSSAVQLSIDFEAHQGASQTSSQAASYSEERPSPSIGYGDHGFPLDLETKSLPLGHVARVARARTAGRLNAMMISEHEHRSLLEERQTLLEKKYEATLDRREENRLTYVDWSLDRIEDAKHGLQLDLLESKIELYEQVGRDIEQLLAELQKISIKKR